MVDDDGVDEYDDDDDEYDDDDDDDDVVVVVVVVDDDDDGVEHVYWQPFFGRNSSQELSGKYYESQPKAWAEAEYRYKRSEAKLI